MLPCEEAADDAWCAPAGPAATASGARAIPY